MKESKLRAVLDYIWITVVIVAVIIASVTLPRKCQAFEPVPDRKAFFQSPVISGMIDKHMEQARVLRTAHPDWEFAVQAWANMETGAWTMNLSIVSRVETEHGMTYVVIMVLPGAPTPWEYRNATGKECLMSLYLDQYEWLNGRNGDI